MTPAMGEWEFTYSKERPVHQFEPVRIPVEPTFRTERVGVLTKHVLIHVHERRHGADYRARRDVIPTNLGALCGHDALERETRWGVQAQSLFDHRLSGTYVSGKQKSR